MNYDSHQEIDFYQHSDPKLMYITENIPTSDTRKEFEEQFCDGCDCTQLCKLENKCKCLLRSGAIYSPTNELKSIHNYIIIITDTNRPLYECNFNCKCQNYCGNRLVQFGPRENLQIRACDETKGLGLVTTKYIKKGNFICEYAGEVITKEEAIRRQNFNKEHNLKNYIICVNEEFGNRRKSTFIDPTILGNIGRYINHSCEPNCDLFIIRISNIVPKVCIFAKEDIVIGCELTFDYGSTINSAKNTETRELVKCLCGSKGCKGYMPFHVYF